MGDNVYLGDRDGVRTPMQWSADRNAGFSDANPQRLYLPVIIDPEYNYETRQRRRPARQPGVAAVVGAPPDRAAQALPRVRARLDRAPVARQPPRARVPAPSTTGRQVLVVANLSRHAQYVELDLSRVPGHAARRAVRTDHVPAIGELPYLLTLGPHAFYWLALEHSPRTAGTDRSNPCRSSLDGPRRGPALRHRQPLGHGRRGAAAAPAEPALVRRQGPPITVGAHRRRGRAPDVVTTGRRTRRCRRPQPARIAFVRGRVRSTATPRRTCCRSRSYPAPRAANGSIEDHPGAAARDRSSRRSAKPECSSTRTSCRATAAPSCRCIATPAARPRRARFARRVPNARSLRARRGCDLDECPSPCCGGEQSNTSLQFDDRLIVKSVRRLEPGLRTPRSSSGARSPTGREFQHAPPSLGTVEYRRPDAVRRPPRGAARVREERRRRVLVVLRRARPLLRRRAESHPTRARSGGHPRRRVNALDLLDTEPPVEFELARGRDPAARSNCSGGARPSCTSCWRRSPATPAFTPEPINLTGAAIDLPVDAQHRRPHAARARARPTATGAGPYAEDAAFVVEPHRRAARAAATTCSAPRAANGSGCTATSTSARCCPPETTSCSSTSRASPRCRSASDGSSARRCATSPACCARSTTRRGPRSPTRSLVAGAQRGTRPRSCSRTRAEEWVTWVTVAYLRGYFEAIGEVDLVPKRPRTRAACSSTPISREGALRDPLRARPPARLGRDPDRGPQATLQAERVEGSP